VAAAAGGYTTAWGRRPSTHPFGAAQGDSGSVAVAMLLVVLSLSMHCAHLRCCVEGGRPSTRPCGAAHGDNGGVAALTSFVVR